MTQCIAALQQNKLQEWLCDVISCIAHHSDMSVAQFIIGLLAVFGQSYFSGITPDITSFPLQISQILGTAYEPHKVQQYARFKQGNMIEICDGAIFNF